MTTAFLLVCNMFCFRWNWDNGSVHGHPVWNVLFTINDYLRPLATAYEMRWILN